MGGKSLGSYRSLILGQAFGALMLPFAAQAQQSGDPLLDVTIDPTYDRGRNISVMDRKHPEFEAIGINLGGFTALPSIQCPSSEHLAQLAA